MLLGSYPPTFLLPDGQVLLMAKATNVLYTYQNQQLVNPQPLPNSPHPVCHPYTSSVAMLPLQPPNYGVQVMASALPLCCMQHCSGQARHSDASCRVLHSGLWEAQAAGAAAEQPLGAAFVCVQRHARLPQGGCQPKP